MTTITIQGFAYCQPAESYEADHPQVIDGFRFSFISMDPKRMPANYIDAGTCTMTIELPEDFDPRAGAVEALKEQRKKIQGEFQARMNEIDKQISQFTAIEFVEAV